MTELNLMAANVANKRSEFYEATTSLVTALTVPANEMYELTSVTAANIDGGNSVDVNLSVTKSGESATSYAKSVSVPPKTVLVIISRDETLNLQEGDIVQVSASANGDAMLCFNYTRRAIE